MAIQAKRTLNELEGLKTSFGPETAARKLTLLGLLNQASLKKPADVLALHETLCFIRAYPDDSEVLAAVERLLEGFARRGDAKRYREALCNSGIAGTPISFSYFAATALWLALNWGDHLTIEWEESGSPQGLEKLLYELGLYCETPGLDVYDYGAKAWIERMRGANETDAAFIIKRLGQAAMSPFLHEILYEDLDLSLRLAPGEKTPSRTRDMLMPKRPAFQTEALDRARPVVQEVVRRPLRRVRSLSAREGVRYLDLCKRAMATRSRDLDAFAYGDSRDVRLVDCGDGYEIVCNGVIPERRFLLETLYGYVMFKNGVPVGYGTFTGLFNSAETAYTVFDTFRASQAARMYGWVLAIGRQLFGFDTFTIDPYQIGHENEDAIQSGAWWFYQKLGFRPKAKKQLALMKRELERMLASSKYRTGAATLRQLADVNLYLQVERERDDVIGVLSMAGVGLKITEFLASRFGSDRAKAGKVCAKEAAKLLGVRSFASWSKGERLAWERWSPLMLILPGVNKWPREDKRALAAVARAKGGRRESDYLKRFDSHRRLRRAVIALADET